jgi:hypothetical protein
MEPRGVGSEGLSRFFGGDPFEALGEDIEEGKFEMLRKGEKAVWFARNVPYTRGLISLKWIYLEPALTASLWRSIVP